MYLKQQLKQQSILFYHLYLKFFLFSNFHITLLCEMLMVHPLHWHHLWVG